MVICVSVHNLPQDDTQSCHLLLRRGGANSLVAMSCLAFITMLPSSRAVKAVSQALNACSMPPLGARTDTDASAGFWALVCVPLIASSRTPRSLARLARTGNCGVSARHGVQTRTNCFSPSMEIELGEQPPHTDLLQIRQWCLNLNC